MIKTLTVPVTADHIANGIRANGQACAIALAMIDAGLEDANVGGSIVGHYRGVTIQMDTPWEVGHWIRRFDNHDRVEPIEITLNIRCPVHEYDLGQEGCHYCASAASWDEDIDQADWDALMEATKRELVPA